MHNWAIVNRFTAQNFIILQGSVKPIRIKSRRWQTFLDLSAPRKLHFYFKIAIFR